MWKSVRSCLMQLKLLGIQGSPSDLSLFVICFLEWLRDLPVKWGTQKKKLHFLILCCLDEWHLGAWAGIPSIQKNVNWNYSLILFENSFNDFGMQRHSLGKVTNDLGVLSKVDGPWAETALMFICLLGNVLWLGRKHCNDDEWHLV